MSLGAVTLVGGLGLMEQSMTLLVLTVVLWSLLHLLVVRVEEPGLEARFGDRYRHYKQSANRWLPSAPRPSVGDTTTAE
jgi:protein-S-isoprenylcysteine O-methyltransferase Ste14